MKTLITTLAVLALLATGAQAVLVHNVTTDTQLFYDDFEGVTPTGGDDDPVAVTGTWYISEPSVNTDVQVVTGSSPAANQGDNCLSVTRANGGGGTRPDAYAQFTATPASSDVIHAEWMVYIGSDAVTYDFLVDYNMANNDLIPLLTAWNANTTGGGASNEIWASVPGSANTDTGLRATLGVWEKWQIDYVVNAASCTLTVGENSVLRTVTRGGPKSLTFRGASPGCQAYIDAVVPEPASLAIVGLGGLLTLVRRRRA